MVNNKVMTMKHMKNKAEDRETYNRAIQNKEKGKI